MIEPEEAIEARLIEVLTAAIPDVKTVGALTPAPEGTEKSTPDTYISVFVDLDAEDPDWRFHAVPCNYNARITVRTAFADGKDGGLFRDTCRAVRTALQPYLGVNCAGLSADGFAIDSFRLVSTETMQDIEATNGLLKAYTFSLMGRQTNGGNA